MNYLYQYQAEETPQANSAFVATLANGDKVYLHPHEIAGSVLVGEWNNDGQLVSMDIDVYNELRPLGNDAGFATAHLGVTKYQGHSRRQVQEIPVVDTIPYYPVDQQPFTLRITRTLTTDDAWPHIPWGWTVEMLSADPLRSIIVRGIGIYQLPVFQDDIPPPEDWIYLYTTGSFVLTDFDELDDEGEPIVVQRYATVCPVGQRTASPISIPFKLLYGAAPEGSWIIWASEEGATQERLFWSEDQ